MSNLQHSANRVHANASIDLHQRASSLAIEAAIERTWYNDGTVMAQWWRSDGAVMVQ